MNLHRLIISFLLLSWAQIGFTQFSIVKDSLESIYTEGNYPGLVFSMVQQNGKTSTFAAGYANREQKQIMSSDTKLLSGSTGKTFVSAVLMQLVIEKRLSLDDPVAKWLGEETWYAQLPNASTLTIKNLAQHQSGIQRYEFKPEFINDLKNDPDRVWKPAELVAYILGDEPKFEAGKGFTYSDTNYILLGMVIEKVTGKPYYEVLETRILKPMGLNEIIPTDSRKIPGLAQGYVDEDDPLGFEGPMLEDGLAKYNLQFEWTGGGLAFRTEDYAKWLTYFFSSKAFDLEGNENQFYDLVDSPEIGGRYGIGFQELTLPKIGRTYGHSGFFPGYFTLGVYLPDHKVAFAIQVNSTQTSALQHFFKDFIRLSSTALNVIND